MDDEPAWMEGEFHFATYKESLRFNPEIDRCIDEYGDLHVLYKDGVIICYKGTKEDKKSHWIAGRTYGSFRWAIQTNISGLIISKTKEYEILTSYTDDFPELDAVFEFITPKMPVLTYHRFRKNLIHKQGENFQYAHLNQVFDALHVAEFIYGRYQLAND